MSKTYKKKNIKEESIEEVVDTLSKKEQYDLNKKKKEQAKLKDIKNKEKKSSKKKISKPKNLGARIFAIAMLILMIASVLVSIFAYL